MTDADLALMPVFLPLLGACLSLAAKARGGRRGAAALELIGAAVGLLLPWAALARLYPAILGGGVDFVVGSWHPAIGIVQRFDGLALLVDVLGFTGAGAAYLYSRGGGPRGPLFTAVFLIQTSALAAAASTADLFNLFVCLEILGLSSYVLVAYSQKGGAFLAAFSYLAVSSAAMVFFLFGIFGLYRLTGALSYRGIAAALAALPDAGGAAAALSTACIAVAVAIRCAVMPVYGWLPDAHAMAPHAVSAVLSGVLIKTPLFALARLLAFLPDGPGAMAVIGWAGAATALIAVLLALAQKDAKRLLAYHSISQIGYVVAAWGLGTSAGLGAAFAHAFNHALFKGLLFLSVGAAVDAAGTRDVYALRGAAGALRRRGDRLGIAVICYAVGALSIAAVPPFNGFASKTAIGALFKSGPVYWVLFAAGVCTVASFVKLSRIFLPVGKGAPAVSPEAAPQDEGFRVRPQMLASMAILAALCAATGAFAPRILRACAELMVASALPLIGGSGAETGKAAAHLFDLWTLLKAAASVALGFALFFAAASPAGKRAAAALRALPRSFSGLVFAFCSALAFLAAYLVFF